MSEDEQVSGAASRYAEATTALRSTIRWVLTALAAIGGILVAGLQLTQLVRLGWQEHPIRFGIAAACVLAGVLAVAYIVRVASTVFTDQWVTLSQLGEETIDAAIDPIKGRSEEKMQELRKSLEKKLNAAAPELFAHVAASLPELYRQVRLVNEQSAEAVQSATSPTTTSPTDDEAVFRRVRYVQAAASAAVDFANYHRTLALLRSLKRRLIIAAVVIVVAIITFSVTAAVPATSGGGGSRTGAFGAAY